MAKKSKPFDMGEYTPDKKDAEAWVWCIRNGILISPVAITEGRYKYYFDKYENKI